MLGQQNSRVLLIDNEPLIRRVISTRLVAAGYVVRTAVDGLDAIGKLRGGLPDLIISDITMPRMSGVEFLHVVRQRFPQMPVILISAMPRDEMPEGVAADAYLYKSSGFEQLLPSVADLIPKPSLRNPAVNAEGKAVAAKGDGHGQYILNCEECLRTFSVPPAPRMGKDERRTICTHCGKVVQFFVAEGLPQNAPQAPRPRPGFLFALNRAAEQFRGGLRERILHRGRC